MNGRACTITLLGQVAIVPGGGGPEPGAWRGRRAELVFAYLVVEHHRPVTQSELADALWPERLPDTWEAALRGVLTDVRRFVSEGGLDAGEVLTTVRHGYRMRLPDDVTVDLDDARSSLAAARALLSEGAGAVAATRAAHASRLAGLPFLPNHDGEWVDGIRRELTSITARALEVEARAHALAGDLAAAAAAAERLVRAEPFNETAHQLRIRVLGQAGDRAGAIVAYEHCRHVLATELGVDPSAETVAAHRAATEPDRGPGVPTLARDPAPAVAATADAAVAATADAAAGAAGATAAEDAPVHAGTDGLGKLSVLVVEDHDFQRRTALMLLRNLGVGTLAEATDGIAALALLGTSLLPDVIVCDIDMPGMDGVEFITHVAEQELAGAVIIASALDAKVIDAVRAVGEGYGLQILGALEKPLTARRLGELLSSYRPRSWQRRPATHAGDAPGSVTAADAAAAIADGRIRIRFRPGVDVATGRVTTADTAPCWLEPGHGLLPQDAYMPVLARERLLPELMRLALRSACTALGDVARSGLDLRASVALAPDSLHMTELAVEAGDIVRAAGVEPSRIAFALDERVLRTAPGAALGMLTRLRVKGFGVALTNFGMGHAPFEQLRAVPLTEVVLAPALVSGAAGDRERLHALDDTAQLGRRLDAVVVGSGCEREDDLRVLLEVGCDRVTGCFIADDLPGDELRRWISGWDPDRLVVGGHR